VPVTKNGEIQFHLTLQTIVDKQTTSNIFIKFIAGEAFESEYEPVPEKLRSILFLRLPKDIQVTYESAHQEKDSQMNAAQIIAIGKLAALTARWLEKYRASKRKSKLHEQYEILHYKSKAENRLNTSAAASASTYSQ